MKKHPTFKSIAHAKTYLRYHVIFSTKYRKKCLTGIEDEVFAAFKYAEGKSDFKILEMQPDRDHIHFLITFRPAHSIEQVIRRMKQLSTDHLYKSSKDHLGKFYWGKKRRLWTGGYFISTIGYVGEDVINNYIVNQ